jgi:hypothetical protein
MSSLSMFTHFNSASNEISQFILLFAYSRIHEILALLKHWPVSDNSNGQGQRLKP